jgi:alpha-beta hydrolase superfamily lysophospholipase
MMRNPGKIKAAAFAVPMFGFNTEPYPNWVAFDMASALCIAGKCKQYAPGQTDFMGFGKFEEQTSTHSPERFQFKVELFEKHPELLVAGKSNGWIREALNATRQIRSFKKWDSTPSIVLSAEFEDTVRNDSHKTVCLAQKHCEHSLLKASFHDVFNESDEVRNAAFEKISQFLLENE